MVRHCGWMNGVWYVVELEICCWKMSGGVFGGGLVVRCWGLRRKAERRGFYVSADRQAQNPSTGQVRQGSRTLTRGSLVPSRGSRSKTAAAAAGLSARLDPSPSLAYVPTSPHPHPAISPTVTRETRRPSRLHHLCS